MIVFETPHQETFNYIINRFLKLEVFNNEESLDLIIDAIMPEYLRREQYLKCKQTFEELYQWTEDDFVHQMLAFHEFTLYRFINYVSLLQEDDDDYNLLLFDTKARNLINKAAKEDLLEIEVFEQSEDKTDDFLENELCECEKRYYDVYGYADYLFSDLDFLQIPNLYNDRQLGNLNLEDYFGINIDFYFDLLPLDIRKKYKSKHITLHGELDDFIKFITNKLNYGSLSKILWHDNKPISETEIGIILDNLMTFYLKNNDDEILWTFKVKADVIDFEIYRRFDEGNKVLFQLRRANKRHLVKGYEQYLLKKSDKYKSAEYVIICFTDEEYKLANNFISNYVYTETITLYINIQIFDARKKKSASKL